MSQATYAFKRCCGNRALPAYEKPPAKLVDNYLYTKIMKTIKKDFVYNVLSRNNKPSGHVKDGETFMVETELNGGTWLNNKNDLWDPSKSKGPNLTTVISVDDAHIGDTLAVEIIDIKPDKLGYTGFAGWRNKLSQLYIQTTGMLLLRQ